MYLSRYRYGSSVPNASIRFDIRIHIYIYINRTSLWYMIKAQMLTFMRVKAVFKEQVKSSGLGVLNQRE